MEKSKGADYSFQPDKVAQSIENLEGHGRSLLAGGCGSGKTNMAIQIIDHFSGKLDDFKTLVLAHGQRHLRWQFTDRVAMLQNLGTANNLDFFEVTSCIQTFPKEYNILVSIPQTVTNFKSQVDLLVVDEAHHFYFAKTVQDIIERCRPKYVLCMTGTPSKFIAVGGWPIVSIPSEELAKHNVISDCNVSLKIFESGIDIFAYREQTIKDEYEEQILQASSALIDDMIKETHTHKTLVACRFQSQAKLLKERVEKLGYSCGISTCETDARAKVIQKFVSGDVDVMFVVSRAVLGFDFSGLSTTLDFTFSLNPDSVIQLMSRVTRKSPYKKTFIKICPDLTAEVNYTVLGFVLSMMNKEVFEAYRGGFKGVGIPKNVMEDFVEKRRTQKALMNLNPKIDLPRYQLVIDSLKNKPISIMEVINNFTSKTPNGFYNSRENIKAALATCKTRSEARTKFAQAVITARNKGWLEDIYKEIGIKNLGLKWVFSECEKAAGGCRTKYDFKIKIPGAYKRSRENRWLDIFFPVRDCYAEACNKIKADYKSDIFIIKEKDKILYGKIKRRKWRKAMYADGTLSGTYEEVPNYSDMTYEKAVKSTKGHSATTWTLATPGIRRWVVNNGLLVKLYRQVWNLVPRSRLSDTEVMAKLVIVGSGISCTDKEQIARIIETYKTRGSISKDVRKKAVCILAQCEMTALAISKKPKPLYRNREFMHQKYVVEMAPIEAIAESIGSTRTTVGRYLRIFKIPIRNIEYARYGEEIINGKVCPKESEFKVLECIIRMRKEGCYYKTIADKLNDSSVKTRLGVKWNEGSVRNVFKRHKRVDAPHVPVL